MKKTLLQRLNPSGKLVLNLIFLIAALFSSNYYTSLALLLLLILIGVGFREFKWKQIPVLIPFCLFSFSLIWMNGLWGGRVAEDETLIIYSVVFSVPGLKIGTLLALRVLIIIIAGMLFTMSSPPQDLVLSLMQQLSFPPGFAYAVLAVLNLLSDIKTDHMCLKASYRMRQIKGLNLFRSIIPLLAINIRRCENISLAMEARGFCMRGRRSYYRRIVWRRRDTFFLLLCVILILLIYAVTYVKGFSIGYARWNGYH